MEFDFTYAYNLLDKIIREEFLTKDEYRSENVGIEVDLPQLIKKD